jgi:hypothetical protein
MTEQIALRFPEGTRDRIKALARNRESMTSTVLRALAGLEGQGDRCRPDDAVLSLTLFRQLFSEYAPRDLPFSATAVVGACEQRLR